MADKTSMIVAMKNDQWQTSLRDSLDHAFGDDDDARCTYLLTRLKQIKEAVNYGLLGQIRELDQSDLQFLCLAAACGIGVEIASMLDREE